jgi:hypothetical protein
MKWKSFILKALQKATQCLTSPLTHIPKNENRRDFTPSKKDFFRGVLTNQRSENQAILKKNNPLQR